MNDLTEQLTRKECEEEIKLTKEIAEICEMYDVSEITGEEFVKRIDLILKGNFKLMSGIESMIKDERNKMIERIEKFRPSHWELNKHFAVGCGIWISNEDWELLKKGSGI